jgi:REP element-mobilizing transposase RayT
MTYFGVDARREHRQNQAMIQTELALAPRFGWGGRRRGAGRPRGPRRRMPHLCRGKLVARHPCHITLRARAEIPSLRSVPLVRELERSLREVRTRPSFRLIHYSIQSNHLHLLVEAEGTLAMAAGMKSLGARLARAVNRVFRRRGPVLADRYHMRALRSPREVRNALAYVLLNARRHLARRAPVSASVDPASSGRWFDGWQGVPGVQGDDPPAVARPLTWLLRIGWRRHGLLRTDEVPGVDGGLSRSPSVVRARLRPRALV